MRFGVLRAKRMRHLAIFRMCCWIEVVRCARTIGCSHCEGKDGISLRTTLSRMWQAV
jgi:hypothetical protein